MSAQLQATRAGPGRRPAYPHADAWLALAVALLVALGLVMVASSSVAIAERATGNPLYYFERQLLFLTIGLSLMGLVYRVPLEYWDRAGPGLMILAFVLLVLVLVPGFGKTVNGATRWLPVGVFNLQVSELVKPFVIVYLAGYVLRRGAQLREELVGFIKPMALIAVLVLLLLLEPDFGASIVLLVTAVGMLFLGGVRLSHFVMLILGGAGAMAVVAVSSPYRLQRLTGFLDPWQDPFDSGFQLTQSLIAIGSGGWFGTGLGGSIQKLFYLPEAHTDFVFAVLAEELGMVGVMAVIGLFLLLVWRCFVIAERARSAGLGFGAFLAYGVGIWLSFQAVVNMGVNMGLLPTKGLTLPLVSSGGSSILAVCIGLGLVFRVQREYARQVGPAGAAVRPRGPGS